VLYDTTALAEIAGKRESIPAVREGWERFAARLQTIDEKAVSAYERSLETLRERARELGGNKRFTLGNYVRELSKEAHRLAFYYRMTAEPAAAEGARRLLLALCLEEAWLYQVGGNRRSDLWTADIGVNASIAFAAIRSVLSDEERAAISNDLREKAFLPLYDDWLHPAKRIHALDTMGHNWWSVCAAGAGVVLLTLGEEREGDEAYLHAVAEGLKEWFAYPGNVLQNKKANFGAGGDYIETMSYLDYALSNVVVFESLYRRRTGDDGLLRLPMLEGVPDAYIATVYRAADGTMKTLNFGDVGDRASYTHVWLRLGELLRRGDMLAFYHAFKSAPDGPLELFYYPSALTPTLSLPSAGTAVLAHSGYAVLRAERHDGGETLFAIKTGESWNHNHLDVGTFQLISGGKEMIVDSGYCVYSKPLYNSYYRQSRAHNVVLLSGEGQPPEMIEFGTKFEGTIPVTLEAPGYRYVLADCTGPYMHLYHRFYRHVVFADRFLVLWDDLHANRDGDFEWLLHYDGTAERSGDATRIANDGETLEVRHLYPERKTYATEQGYLSSFHRVSGMEDVFPEAEYISIRASAADRRMKFVNVFLLPGEDPAALEIATFGDERVQAFRIRDPQGDETAFYCNTLADGRVMHDNSHVRFDRVETDAFLVSLTVDREGRLMRVSLHNGSYLKVDGDCLFSALLKCDAVLDYRDGLDVRTATTATAWCYFKYDGDASEADGVRYDPNVGMYMKRLEAGAGRFRLPT